jgi:hypothetical protein
MFGVAESVKKDIAAFQLAKERDRQDLDKLKTLTGMVLMDHSESLRAEMLEVQRQLREEEDSRSRPYVTKKGDTLFSITQDQLGGSARYQEVIDLNRTVSDVLNYVKGHEHIKVGTVLRLPKTTMAEHIALGSPFDKIKQAGKNYKTKKFLEATGVDSSSLTKYHELWETLPDIDPYFEKVGREILKQAMSNAGGVIGLRRSLMSKYRYNVEYQTPKSEPNEKVLPDYFVAQHLVKIGYLARIKDVIDHSHHVPEYMTYQWRITEQGRKFMFRPAKDVELYTPSDESNQLLQKLWDAGGQMNFVFKISDLADNGLFNLHYQSLITHKLIAGSDVTVSEYGYRMQLWLTDDGKKLMARRQMQTKLLASGVDELLYELDKMHKAVTPGKTDSERFKEMTKGMKLNPKELARLEAEYLRNINSVDFMKYQKVEDDFMNKKMRAAEKRAARREELDYENDYEREDDYYGYQQNKLKYLSYSDSYEDEDDIRAKIARTKAKLDVDSMAKQLAKRSMPGRGGFGATAVRFKMGQLQGTDKQRFKFKKQFKTPGTITRFRRG